MIQSHQCCVFQCHFVLANLFLLGHLSLKSAQSLLEKTVLTAPVPGFVVYKKVSVQGEMRKVQVGDSVWQHNGFIVLPDMSEIITDLKIRETDIAQLEVGQTALVRPQAYPNMLLKGRVETIGTLATGKNEEMPRFLVRVAINDIDPKLRPGMTVRTRIQAAHLKDTASSHTTSHHGCVGSHTTSYR